ncbi:MAG: helix-turn-helix transcriptional regulator [Sphingobacteriales bacterium]|jgi:AraC-like DNA-binding protein|nr:MAG: helix-turn-helix transcriptional regulator [Sphingobacteriales bacterium]
MESKQRIILMDVGRLKDLPRQFLTFYQTHIYCHKGKLEFIFKDRKYECLKGGFVFWFAESDVKEISFSKDFEASVLLVEKQFLMDNIPDRNWSIDVQLYSRDNPIQKMNKPSDKVTVLKNFNRLNDCYLESKHLFYEDVLRLEMNLFLFQMWNIFSNAYQRRKRTVQTGTLYERFQNLILVHCMQEREVQFYADQLHITAKYLNFICKQNSNTTASEWIQRSAKDRIVLLLQNNNFNISEIADEMNFSSRSFFTHYVKKLIGMTPKEYRERLS